MSRSPPKPVILDTDPGVDDALALLYLRANPALRLLAMTTVFGNADVETTTRNALYLRDRFCPDTPVYRGAAAPLARPRGAAPTHVHGDNGLGDIAVPSFTRPVDPGVAHERIIALARAHPGQITLIAIGPLTNLALALRAAPDIAGLIAQVVVMGGAFGTGGKSGNVTPFAEANIHNDPEAADAVLAAAWPVTLIGLDVTTLCVLTNADALDLAKFGGEEGRFANDVSRGYAAAYARHEGLDGCCLHDVAAVAYAVDPTPFHARRGAITVGLDEARRGQTRWSADDGRPLQSACLSADTAVIVADFLRALTRAT
ncbi:nucleoside hydrolase [soil metagenome]